MNCKRNNPCSAIKGQICQFTTCANYIKAVMQDMNETRLSYPEPFFKENYKRPEPIIVDTSINEQDIIDFYDKDMQELTETVNDIANNSPVYKTGEATSCREESNRDRDLFPSRNGQ